MNKAPLFTALCVVALVLAGCAGNSGSGSTGGNSFAGEANGNGFRSGAARTISPDAKLALGTIKLEGTGQAIDPKAAARLIPLWQLMVQLHSSSSAAPQEVTAVLDEIQATMTPAQLNTIRGMSFNSADIFSLLQSEAQASSGAGGTRSFGSSGGSGRTRQGGQFFFGGGTPGGGFGAAGLGGGGFGGGGIRTTNGTAATGSTQLTPAQEAQAAQARENATSSLVENQLIRLLENKLSQQPG